MEGDYPSNLSSTHCPAAYWLDNGASLSTEIRYNTNSPMKKVDDLLENVVNLTCGVSRVYISQ